MDREEKLRAAKEKLKRFQTQKKKPTPDLDSQRSTPKLDEPPLFTAFAPGASNDTNDPFVVQPNNDRSLTSSSVSDQISNVLEAPSIVDVADNELEVIKARLSQLDREKMEMSYTVQQQNLQIQHLIKEAELANVKLSSVEVERQEQLEKNREEAIKVKSLLDSYVESTQILVSEKAELQSDLEKVKMELADIKADNERLLKSKHTGPSAKERQCACTDRVFLAEVERQKLSDTVSNLRDEKDRLKIETIDLRQEVLELKSKIEFAERGILVAAGQLMETTAKLELAEVNLAQLRAANEARRQDQDVTDDSEEEAQITQAAFHKQLKDKEEEIIRLGLENEEHVKRVAELTAYIQQASNDREQIIQQYTSYSQQLASQIESLTQQLNVKAAENHSYATRESDLVAHVQRLEGQLQSSMLHQDQQQRQLRQSSKDRWSPSAEKEMDLLRSKVVELDKTVLELHLEREKLMEDQHEEGLRLKEALAKCKELQENITDLETKLEMTSEKSALIDPTRHESLVAASESDKVAASRAMKQNQQLKVQVEELENAILQLTNSKAELITDLDATLSKVKKFEVAEDTSQKQIKALQEAIKERDRNLSAVRDQIKYYTAFAEHSIKGSNANNASIDASEFEKLVKDLHISKDKIRCLNSENLELRSQLEVLSGHEAPTPDSERCQNGHDTSSSDSSISSQLDLSTMAHHGTDNDQSPRIPEQVAVMKLEQKFKQAMHRVAELTSEKEHLEHLIARLQDETDTVGEYITIYQYQRAQQKARLDEKERQLQSLSRDREELKSKVDQLQTLVKNFVTVDNGSVLEAGNLPPPDLALEAMEHSEVANELQPSHDHAMNGKKVHEAQPKENAAQKILTLLSEIGSNEMLNHESSMDQFHPWFWEPAQGKLMTV